MERKIKIIAVILFITTTSIITLAQPAFMNRYNADPYSKTVLQSDCTICHNGYGGGKRNAFGQAFKEVGYQITPQLRVNFPELFESKPTTRLEPPSKDTNASKKQHRKHDDDDDYDDDDKEHGREHDRERNKEHRKEYRKEHNKEHHGRHNRDHHEEHEKEEDDD